MKTLDQMLRELVRPDVGEVAMVSDRLPCIKVGAKYEPIDDKARSTEAIFEILASVGGRRYVDDLRQKPGAWTYRIDGIGNLAVQAAMRDGRVQARFTLLAPSPAAGAPAPSLAQQAAPAPPSAAALSSDPAVHLVSSGAPHTQAELGASNPFARDPAPRISGVVHPPPAPRRNEPSPGSLDGMFSAMLEAGASDLHVVAERPMLLRVGGDLTPRGAPLAAALVEEMLLPIVPLRLKPVLAEQGSADFAIERQGLGRFRVNVARQRTGYKGCFRRIPEQVPTLASLVLPAEIARATHHHQGLVLVTGPTGHGKTTTLAAIVDIINRETTHHVITVEDPVEYVHPRKKAMMSQREIGSSTKSFANALKASLREDPDVIVVGELRDTETVRMALAASETGHLVLGTMNTPSAAKTIDRLVDLFPPADQSQVRMTLAGGLHLVVSQRLVPRADGKGVVAAVELLPGSIALWSLIRDAKTFQIPSLQQRGKGFGILRLDESLLDLVKAGTITKDAALAVAEYPEELEAVLTGKRPAAGAAPAPPPPPPKPEGVGGLLGKAGQLFGGKKGG
jgi:twitching motility protein PilT